MSGAEAKFVLSADVTIQTRRAQNLSPSLKTAIRKLCESNPSIVACFVLDARRPDTGAVALLVAVTLESGEAEMDSIATQFQAMLRQFPEQAKSAFLTSSRQFVDQYAGSEFYVRQAA
jgi:hypothetical protein